MNEVERARALSREQIIDKMVDNPQRVKLRNSYNKTFRDNLFPSDEEFFIWWNKYVDDSTIRGNEFLRAGWLSGIDYGDM